MAFIIGCDEVGLGAIAGPLVVCATVVPLDWEKPTKLRDSKKMSHKQMVETLPALSKLPFFIEERQAFEIDAKGVANAWADAAKAAIRRALAAVPKGQWARVILDGERKIKGVPCEAIPKADDLYPCVSAASVIAKLHRDGRMQKIAEAYPKYGLDRNMGYPTAEHLEQLGLYGASEVHRTSYAPVRKVIGRTKHAG